MTAEGKGSKIRWRADCGHWVECYTLEPTPEQCADCAAAAGDPRSHRPSAPADDESDMLALIDSANITRTDMARPGLL